MLIKYWDRLTIDGFLAVRAARLSGDHAPLRELLKLVGGAGARQGELPFPPEPAEALRFIGGSFLELEAHDATLCSTIADLRGDPDEFAAFLEGDAHMAFPHSEKSIITGYFPRSIGGPRYLGVHEGRTGRKYARTQSEAVDFLMRHPGKDDLLSDLAVRYRLESELRTAGELEEFLAASPAEKLDELIDAAARRKNYLFDPIKFGREIASRGAWFFALSKESRATLDFALDPARNYRPASASFADAEKDLAAALTEIVAFAKTSGHAADAGSFVGGLSLLEDGLPSPRPFWKACGLTPDRQRLLAAALSSDGFSTDGGWNAVPLDQESYYRRPSNRVAFCIIQAICAVVAA
jgi:hypothetical protein